MSKYTPGPFEVQNPMGDDIGLWVVQAGLEAYEWSCIAIVPRDEDRSGKHFITKAEQKANANLFSAAPALLEALTALRNECSGSPSPSRLIELLAQADAAIAKAEGK